MGFRFRKSVKVAPGLKVNLSKSGIGVSGGVRGARVGMNSRGTYKSLGIPGTGLYWMSHGSSSKKKQITKEDVVSDVESRKIKTSESLGVGWAIFINLLIFFVNQIVGVVTGILTFVLYKFYITKQPFCEAKKKLKKGKRDFNEKRYNEASSDLETAYNHFTADKAIALLASFAYAEIENYDKAIRLSEEYINEYPEDIGVRVLNAQWSKQQGNKDKALEDFQSLIQEGVEAPIVLVQTSKLLSDKGLLDAAVEVLKKAPLRKKKLDEGLLDVLYELGVLYEKTGDIRKSQKAFERIYANAPSFKDVKSKLN